MQKSPQDHGNSISQSPLTDNQYARKRGPNHDRRPNLDSHDFAATFTCAQQPLLHDESDSDRDGDDKNEESVAAAGHQRPQRPSLIPSHTSIDRRTSFITRDEIQPTSPPAKEGPVRWRDLPRKGQLAILTLARLSEPITQTSLQAYMFYQLKSFDPTLPDSTISSQAGILQGCFTTAQFLTAIMWGRIADADWGGRKRVMLIGLVGTGLSSVGFGFSRSFVQAAIFRVMGGMLNGNVGVMRTMISEIIKEKKYGFLSRQFELG